MKRMNLKVGILLAVLLALGGSTLAFAAFNAAPTPQDILNKAVSTLQAAQDGHAVVSIQGNTSDKSMSATVEVWAKKLSGGDKLNGGTPSYAFRAEVRDTTDAQAKGAIAVSDGKTVWFYTPSNNTVRTGTVEQMRQMHDQNNSGINSPQDALAKLFDMSTVTLAGTESVQGHTAYKLQLVPKAGKAPQAAMGATGLVWVDTTRSLPLQASVNAGNTGQGRITATTLELNVGVSDDRFRFQVPAGAKVVQIADLQPQHVTLADVDKAAGFKVLKPSYVPAGSTLVDVVKMGKTVVLRYESSVGSFAIAQGAEEKNSATKPAGESVQVRGTTGTLVTRAPSGKQVSLFWTEGGQMHSVSGALTSADALKIAQSLK